jgi:hypothetical protein
MPTLFEPQTAQAIISRVNTLSNLHQRKWGKMDVTQMLKHVNDALGTATGETTIKTNFFFKFFAPFIKMEVMSSKPYKPSLPTAKEFVIKSHNLNFEEEKNALINRLNKFLANGESAVEGLKHPAFGKMTAYEWGFSQWKHFDHHLRQFGV